MRVGGPLVRPGDVIQFSGSPGSNFEEVEDAKGTPIRPKQEFAPEAKSSQQSSSGSSARKTKE